MSRSEFLLAPWSLSQFYVDDKTIASFGTVKGGVRDLYAPSKDLLTVKGDVTEMVHDKVNRIQLALPEESKFVQLIVPDKKLVISRTSAPLADGLEAVDIADAAVDVEPAGAKIVREKRPEAILIFVMPPSVEELERRLRSRGDTDEEQIRVRLARVQWEMEQSKQYDQAAEVLSKTGKLSNAGIIDAVKKFAAVNPDKENKKAQQVTAALLEKLP